MLSWLIKELKLLALTSSVSSVAVSGFNSFFCFYVSVLISTYSCLVLACYTISDSSMNLNNLLGYVLNWLMIESLRLTDPAQRMTMFFEIHGGSVVRSISYYFFLGGM